MTFKNPVAWLGVAVFTLILLANQWTRQIEVTVHGRIGWGKDQALPGALVIVQPDGRERDPDYYEVSDRNGQFSLNFQALEGAPAKIIFEKKGFVPLEIQQTFSGQRAKEPLPAVWLIRDPNVPLGNQPVSLGTAREIPLRLFAEQDEESYSELYSFSRIEHFDLVTKATRQYNASGEERQWYKVVFTLRDKDRLISGFVFQ